MRINILGPAYDTNIPSFQGQKCINWYLEPDGVPFASSKYPMMLKQIPGIVEGIDTGDFNRGRASIVYKDVAYVVIDEGFAELETDGVPSYLDFLNTSTSPVSITGGLNGVFLADGTNAYYWSLVDYTLHIISDADITTLPDGNTGFPTGVAYSNGYYILTFADSQYFFYSTDPLAWDALNFYQANSSADPIVTCGADHDELWFFGTSTTEVWYFSDDANSPIQRRPGAVISKGCAARDTLVKMDNTFFWLATDPNGGFVIVRANGYNPEILSTPALTSEIAGYSTVADAFAYSHRVGLHEFYVITFPTAQKTWAYDILTQQWHERVSIISLDPNSATYDPFIRANRVKTHFYAYDTHWVLDQYTGGINYYDTETYTELGLPLYRQRRTSAINADKPISGYRNREHDNKVHSYYNLVLNMEQGVGTGSGQGENPVVMLSISPDGGHTWETLSDGAIGALGTYDEEIKWDIIGQARDLVLDFRVTDPVNAVLLGATIDEIPSSRS